MKILIIGADGQVGGFLQRELSARHTVLGAGLLPGPGIVPLDIRQSEAVDRLVETYQPDYIILTAALTHVDRCEEDPALAEAVNVQGTRHVAEAAVRAGSGLAFFSSDYVFDGEQGPYTEQDLPHPISVYGQTKLEGERMVAGLLGRYLIIRPMFVFSYLPGSMNFFMQVKQRAEQGLAITAPDDQWGNPTQAENLAAALSELIETGQQGIFHLAGTTRVHKAEFARAILRHLGYDAGLVRAVATAALGQKAPRPLNSGLVVNKAQLCLRQHRLWDLDHALAHTLARLKIQPA